MISVVGVGKLIEMVGPGAFVLNELVERILREGTDEERKELGNVIGDGGLVQNLSDSGSDVKGREALLARVSELQASI